MSPPSAPSQKNENPETATVCGCVCVRLSTIDIQGPELDDLLSEDTLSSNGMSGQTCVRV